MERVDPRDNPQQPAIRSPISLRETLKQVNTFIARVPDRATSPLKIEASITLLDRV